MRHKTLFISDLHLQLDEAQIYALFETFINQLDDTVDAIYILGDLFEFWIGDDDVTPFHTQVMHLLKQTIDDGIPVFVQHGNRDFLLGKQFLSATGCTLLPEEICINLYNTPVLLVHGDTLCWEDKAYQKMRRCFRNRFMQKAFLRLPLTWRRNIAKKIRARSQMHVKGIATPDMMDVTPAAVSAVMDKHQVDYLIHGHTHKPAIHQHQTGTRIVLGAWHEKASVLTWYEDGETHLSW